MRTLRLSLAGVMTTALLVGVSGGVAAQNGEEEQTTPTGVTGRVLGTVMPSRGQWTQIDEVADIWLGEGVHHMPNWEASDPRLNGRVTYRANWMKFRPIDIKAEAVRWTIVNDGGSWSGTGRGIQSGGHGDMESMVLIGDGDYEGLTAFLSFDHRHEEGTFRGFIVSGDLPQFPEPSSE